MDWQTYIAGAIVMVTLAIFLLRLARPRKHGNCGGHGCGGCRKR